MVFACLVLSVFATIDEYEEEASVVLLKMVRNVALSSQSPQCTASVSLTLSLSLSVCLRLCLSLSPALVTQELIMVFWFAGEFGARIWSVGCRSRYQGWIGRLRFLRSPFCVIGESRVGRQPQLTHILIHSCSI